MNPEPTTLIRNNDEFADWLESVGWLRDCYVRSVSPAREINDTEKILHGHLTISLPVTGSYEAGAELTSREFLFECEAPTKWALPKPVYVIADHCSEGIDLIETESGCAFCIDVPSSLEVHCSQVIVKEQPLRTERNTPWLNRTVAVVTLIDRSRPSPHEWIELFQSRGIDVAWRYYCGEPKDPRSVPDDYEGWFLQRRELVDSTTGGLQFLSCKPFGSWGCSLSLHDEQKSGELLVEVILTLISLGELSIRSGNCSKLSADQWRAWIESGELPKF